MKHTTILSFYMLCLTLGASTLAGQLLYTSIAQENLKSLVNVEEKAAQPLRTGKLFYEVLKDTVYGQLHPLPEIKRRLAFTLLAQHEKERTLPKTAVLDERSWQDLEILCGPKANPGTYLAAKIDRTSTEIGRLTLYRKMVQPAIDYTALKKQQAIVKELIRNNDLFEQLDSLLKELLLPENALFSFWDSQDIFWKMLEREEFTMPFQEKSPALKVFARWLDRNELWNELQDKSYLMSTVVRGTVMTASTITLPLYAVSVLMQKQCPWLEKINTKLGVKGILASYGLLGYLYTGIDTLFPSRFTKAGIDLTAGVTGEYFVSSIYRHLKTAVIFNDCIQEKLIHVATYFSTLEHIAALIERNTLLSELIETHALLFKEIPAGARYLLQLLKTDTFKGIPSFLSYSGRIISAYKLLYAYKEHLLDALAIVGELDMYLSIARLYREFEQKQVRFCFPEYIFDAETPFIVTEHFWNPMLAWDKAIPNSLTLGGSEMRNCAITGPNAGGKSTILRALVLSVILAQSIGIAPAEKLIITPFTSITTYLNITDDIAAGNSLFKAGVLRARELLERVDVVKGKGFALTAVDEVFNGTTCQEGQAAAYTLLKTLGDKPFGICVTATHFPFITHLERESGTFTNYKVSVAMNEKQNIQYPYKLEKGISDQVITFKILQEEGFSDNFLSEAQHILDGNRKHML
jgi:DNA mismatch repair protein MutS